MISRSRNDARPDHHRGHQPHPRDHRGDGDALFHSGYSPILRESQDGTAGLTDAQGRHHGGRRAAPSLAALYRAVASVCARYPTAEMRDGDSFISNDPYKAGNSHAPDIVVTTPIFHGGRIIAFSECRLQG